MASSFFERFSSGQSRKHASKGSARVKAKGSGNGQRPELYKAAVQVVEAQCTSPSEHASKDQADAHKVTLEKNAKLEKPIDLSHDRRNAVKLACGGTVPNVERPSKTLQRGVLAPKSIGVKKLRSEPKYAASTVVTTKIPLKVPHEREMSKDQEHERPKSTFTTDSAKLLPEPKTSEKSRFEHPLSLSFKDASKNYTDQLKEGVPSLLVSGYARLKGQLAAASASSATKLDDLKVQQDALFCPLGSVELEIHTNKGKPDEKVRYVTLATRILEFTSLFEKSKEKLNGLQEKWQALRDEVGSLKITEEEGVEPARGTYLFQLQELALKYRAREEKVNKRFEQKLGEIMEKATEAEKMFDERRRQSNKQLLLLLQQEEEVEI